MMQLYYVLDMEYADAAKQALHLLQRAVFKLGDDLPMSHSVSYLSLFIKKEGHAC
jgi:hypothetical protein